MQQRRQQLYMGTVPNTNTDLITMDELEQAEITYAHAYNSDTSTRELTLSIVKTSGTVDLGKWQILSDSKLSLWELVGGILAPGDILRGIASTAGVLDLKIDGDIYTQR